MFSLKLDSATTEPREVQAGGDGDGFQTPCTISGAMAGLSGGALGYVFGFGESTLPISQPPWTADGRRRRGAPCALPRLAVERFSSQRH